MLLILGILLWAGVHLFTALGTNQRQHLIDRLGRGPYRGLYSLALVGSLTLVVMGWKALPPESLYVPPPALRHLTMLLMPIAIILFFSSRAPTDIKQIIRHPQLTGVKLWAVAHLLANGETRAVILFTGLLAWAVLEVIVINRRDGAWKKPARVGVVKTLVSAALGLAITGLLMLAHPWLAGVPILTR